MNIEEFLSYVKEAKAKATYKNYSQGLKKFIEWYGKDGDTILKERFQDLQSQDMNVRKRFNSVSLVQVNMFPIDLSSYLSK